MKLSTRRSSVFTLASLALLAGCQTPCPPFRAAWYLHEENGRPLLHLAIMNEGRKEVQVNQIIINPAAAPLSTVSRWPVEQSVAEGDLLVVKVTGLIEERALASHCAPAKRVARLPARVAVQCDRHEQVGWARMSGTMPNYLPDSWVSCQSQSGAGAQ